MTLLGDSRGKESRSKHSFQKKKERELPFLKEGKKLIHDLFYEILQISNGKHANIKECSQK